MNFIKEKIKDFYLLDTRLENIFINEYMPAAPGDFVKIYLYAVMYAEHGLAMSVETMAKQLGVSEKMITDAWNYWESMGVIRKHFTDSHGGVDFTVEFLSLKELLYGKNTAPVREQQSIPENENRDNVFGNKAVRQMFDTVEKTLGRPLSSSDISRIMSWMTEYNATPEIICFGVEYCMERRKTSLKYMEKVITGWARDGLITTDQVSEHIQELDERYYRYKRVLKALGFTRNATETEKEMMDTWFDEMGYSMERVLEACTKTAGISSPNFNYVNRVLENWQKDAEEKGIDVNKKVIVTQSVLNRYYDFLREKAEREAQERKEEIYSKLPRIRELDDEIRKLSSKLSKALIMSEGKEETGKISDAMDRLTSERAFILTENNYEMDYTDIRYGCEKCKDTGITDQGERCTCIGQRTGEAEIWVKKKSLEE